MPKENTAYASVTWSKDHGHVQLGVYAQNILDESFDSLWTDLSRDEINRLIWSLRKARDQAYGRDA